MKTYEVTLILLPLLEEQQVQDVLQRLTSFVQEKGGILGEQHTYGKRPLLAPIKKYTEGYMAALSFSLLPEHIEEFKVYCRQQQDVVRFIITRYIARKPKRTPYLTPAKKPFSKDSSTEPSPSKEPTNIEKEVQKEEKISVSEIDEKLEEIFKTTK